MLFQFCSDIFATNKEESMRIHSSPWWCQDREMRGAEAPPRMQHGLRLMWHLFDSERQLIKVPLDLCHHVLCIYPAGAVHNGPWQILLFLLQNFVIWIKSVNDTQGREAHTAYFNAYCSGGKVIYDCGRDHEPSTFAQRHQFIIVLPLQHKAV